MVNFNRVNFKFDGFYKSYSDIHFENIIYFSSYKSFVYEKALTYDISFPKLETSRYLNIFQLFGPNELHHSKYLGQLIDPLAIHGYGDVFLELFFKIVLNDYKFEYNVKEKWIITVERLGRFDIRIRNMNNSKIIILENKSNGAEDRPNQLYRYWYNGIFKPQSVLSESIPLYGKILYLSPGKWKKPSMQSLTRPVNIEKDIDIPDILPKNIVKIKYFSDEIVGWLSACMDAIDNNTEIHYCLKQYYDYWRKFHGRDY